MKSKTIWYRMIIAFMVVVGVFTASVGFAVPAAPGVHELKHQDGTTVKARQWGDESLHGWQTEDGYTIVFDAARKSWTYAVAGPDGGLVSSGKIAGRDTVPANLTRKLRPTAKYRSEQPVKTMTREAAHVALPDFPEGKTKSDAMKSVISPDGRTKSTSLQRVVPPSGTANIPVILVNFSDTATSYTNTDFNTLLFGTGNFSMKDFYQEVSYATFNISSGPGGIGLWSTATNTHDYYGRNVAGDDQFPGTLVREAIAAADAAGFNFAAYDQDGDCYVDVVNIVHQGTGEEASGIATDIWSHRWNLNSAFYFGQSDGGEYTTNDVCPANPAVMVKVNDYVVQPEKLYGTAMITVGVFAHEYGHALGLPDLYDTDGTSEGIGDWSLMAGGSWNGLTAPGDRPAHADAWSKFFLGWVTPTVVNGSLANAVISAASGTVPDVYQLRDGAPTSGEYFLVENRQKTGFDIGLPGEGLLIWHIDGTYIAGHPGSVNGSECYPPADCSVQHYGVALVQADNAWNLENGSNRGDAGDPYASPANEFFTDVTAPASNLYSGGASGVSVTGISAPGAAMTATFAAPTNIYFLNEAFSSGTLPSGWSVVNNVGSAGWTFNDPGVRTNRTGGTGSFAIADSDNAGSVNMDTELISPVMDLAGASTASLEFKTDFVRYSGAPEEIADVDVSNDGGATWNNVWEKTGASYSGPKSETVDITALAAGQANVKIRFHYYNANYDFWWQVDDVRVLTMVFTNTLIVTKSGSGSGTVTSDPAGISCGGTCAASYTAGTLVTLTATPDAGFTFAGWSGSCTGTGTCVVTMDGAKSVTAAFMDMTVPLSETFSSGSLPSGWTVVDNALTGAVWTFNNPGGRTNLTGGTGSFAIADSDYAGSVAMDTELISPVMDLAGASTVSFQFKTDFLVYSGAEIADADVSNDGGVTWSNVWKKTGASYHGPITETVDITALAAGQANVKIRFHYYNANWDFWWQVDDVNVVVTMITHTVTASAPGGNGSISCDPPTVIYGGSSVCTITPASGYYLAGLTDNAADVLSLVSGSTYTINMVTTDHTVIASFAINTYTVTASAGPNGSLDTAYRTSPQSVNYGGTTSFRFTGDTGYQTASVSGCGGSFDSGTGIYTTGPIYGDCTVSATFTVLAQYSLSVNRLGNGLVTSNTGSISCGTTCGAAFFDGTVVTLTATPDAGWNFAGWSGACTGAGTCDITMDADKTVMARFVAPAKIGVFTNGYWYLDANQSWDWNGTPTDILGTFGIGLPGAIPVVGDWNGDGKTEIGIYVNGEWYLDMNNNWQWDGEPTDVHGVFGAGLANPIPVVGDWNGDGKTEIGIYSDGNWFLDTNQSWAWEGAPADTYGVFGTGLSNPVPVTGDWNGDGITEIGIYSDGNWYLDKNQSWAWEGEPADTYGVFGSGLANPVPVTGDWDGSGITKIGIFSEGNWFLDTNASWQWDGTPTDTFGVFGMGLGTVVPVTGNW